MSASVLRSTPVVVAALAIAACSRNEEAVRDASAAARAGSTPAAPASTGGGSPSPTPELARADAGRIAGDTAAPVWLVVVSDFQCPYCKQWADQTAATVTREYVRTGKVRMAFINFPLSMHPNAQPASEAAMCAAAQDKFWPVHDAIFATQERWARLPDARPHFDSLATAAGVNGASFRACVSSGAMRPLVAADAQRAQSAGVNSTPTFLITAVANPGAPPAAIAGAAPAATFRATLDSVLRSAGAAR